MHVVNAMFGKGLGGIEQALVDYCEALKLKGHKVTAIISYQAKIKPSLLSLGVNIIEIRNFAVWDVFAKLYLKKILEQINPDVVINHGNRAICLVKGAVKRIAFHKHPVIIAVTHNYRLKYMRGLDAVFAITEDLKSKVLALGQPERTVFKLPNMVRIKTSETEDVAFRKPVVIGAMGRFVKKKGFDIFIRALADLKEKGIPFIAILGGAGEEENNLKTLALDLQLDKNLTFIGWVQDKDKFFHDIDLFVLPSIHEPFGIILLEALSRKKPIITTDAEGPVEIVQDGFDAVIVPKKNDKILSAAIERLIGDEKFAKIIAKNGFAKANTYDIKNFASLLDEVLVEVCAS